MSYNNLCGRCDLCLKRMNNIRFQAIYSRLALAKEKNAILNENIEILRVTVVGRNKIYDD